MTSIDERRRETRSLVAALDTSGASEAQLNRYAEELLFRPVDLCALSEQLLASCGWDPDDGGEPSPVPQEKELPMAA